MKILLDTHAFLWFIAGNEQLHSHARTVIEDETNERYLSIAAVWEITIKSSLGRLTVPLPPSRLVREHAWTNAIDLLSVTPEHLDTLYQLPYHHNDPFDRILIAQAKSEEMTLLTRDRAFDAYGVRTAWSA